MSPEQASLKQIYCLGGGVPRINSLSPHTRRPSTKMPCMANSQFSANPTWHKNNTPSPYTKTVLEAATHWASVIVRKLTDGQAKDMVSGGQCEAKLPGVMADYLHTSQNVPSPETSTKHYVAVSHWIYICTDRHWVQLSQNLTPWHFSFTFYIIMRAYI